MSLTSQSSRPSALRRSAVLAWAAMVVGGVVLGMGAFLAVWLGPSGRVGTSVISQAGVVVVGQDVLASSDTLPEVEITSPGGGKVTLLRTLDEDAVGIVQSVRRTTVTGVSFLPRELLTVDEGEGRLAPSLNTDVYLRPPETGERVHVAPADISRPQALVAFTGQPGDVRDDPVTLTLTWQHAMWFWQAVATAVAGAAVLGWGVLTWRRSHGPVAPLDEEPQL